MAAETEAHAAPTRLAAILAGGHSRRMGRPKATLELAGRPLLSYPLAAARAAALEPVVVAKAGSPLPELDCRLVTEPERPSHPLAGLIAALEQARGPVVALACDTPFVPASLIAALARAPEPLVAVRAAGRLHPLLARYSPELLDELRRGLEEGASLRGLLTDLGVQPLDGPALAAHGDPSRITFNVNSPADLARAEQMLTGG